MSHMHSTDLAVNIENLTAGYPDKVVIPDLTWQVPRGTLSAIIGPNGGGKSTLLKTAIGLLPPFNYTTMELLGESPRKVRSKVAYLPQQEEVDWSFPITVLDVVLQGRLLKHGFWGRSSKEDQLVSHEAIEFFGLEKHKHTQIGSLSGGQRQRVFLARALVQKAELILLDEPSTGLDANAQHELADLFWSLRQEGKTIVAATHDLNCLTECFDHVLALDGHALVEGKPEEVLTEANMVRLFSRHFPKVRPSGEVTLHDH